MEIHTYSIASQNRPQAIPSESFEFLTGVGWGGIGWENGKKVQ